MAHMKLSWHTLHSITQRIWQYLLVEPSHWLFVCFFQPARFRREFEHQAFLKRILFMFRLALPLFLLSYPFALTVQVLLSDSFLSRKSFEFSSIPQYLLSTIQATTLGIGCGILAGAGE